MKMNEWLEEINRKEADILDKCMCEEKNDGVEMEEKRKLARQEQMVLEKIRKETKGYHRHFSRRAMLVFIAAAVLALGTVAVAAENGGKWLTQLLGFSQRTEQLEGGFVSINKSAECNGITITASQAIGDKNCQWIELDTNVLWSERKETYEDFDVKALAYLNGKACEDGTQYTSFYKKGEYLSIIVCLQEVENINEATIKVKVKGKRWLVQNDRDGIWKLSWKNNYKANVRTVVPKEPVEITESDGTKSLVHIDKIDISPISIRIKIHGDCVVAPELQSITFKDKSVMKIASSTGGTARETEDGKTTHFESFYSLDKFDIFNHDFPEESLKKMNLKNIDSVTIGGAKITID